MNAPISLQEAYEASWPAAEYARTGALLTGRGLGGGMRVSSTRPTGPDWTGQDIDDAIATHLRWQQEPCFRLDEGDSLETRLEQEGWQPGRRTLILTLPAGRLTDQKIPPVTGFTIWPPMAIQRDIWTAQGIGAERQAVMERVTQPKTAILGRTGDRAAGSGFVAAIGSYCAIHAIEVVAAHRRKGLATWMLRCAALWAVQQGCETLILGVTAENAPAIALYERLGFREHSVYRYWWR